MLARSLIYDMRPTRYLWHTYSIVGSFGSTNIWTPSSEASIFFGVSGVSGVFDVFDVFDVFGVAFFPLTVASVLFAKALIVGTTVLITEALFLVAAPWPSCSSLSLVPVPFSLVRSS
jgi:hypothetical protein